MQIRNKEHLVQILENPTTVDFLIKILKDKFNCDLPDTGHLCGQSLSSAFTELLNMDINYVYNDIDIFYIVHASTFRESNNFKRSRDIQKGRTNNTSYFRDFFVDSDYYSQITYINSISHYKVEHSFSMGPINKTYVSMLSNIDFGLYEFKDLTYSIIENFDINSTQIGIELSSRKIVYTDNFLNFILSRQLEISKWNTPVHSLIRIEKKKQELGNNVFYNLEENKMLSLTYISVIQQRLYEAKKSKVLMSLEDPSSKHYEELVNSYFTHDFNSFSNLPIFFGSKHKSDFDLYLRDNENFTDLSLAIRGDLLSTMDKIPTNKDESQSLKTIQTKENEKYFEEYLSGLRNSNFSKSKYSAKFIKNTEEFLYLKNDFSVKRDISYMKHLVLSEFERTLLLPYTYKSIINSSKKNVKVYDLSKSESEKDKSKYEKSALNTFNQEVEFLFFKDFKDFSHEFLELSGKLNSLFRKHNLRTVLDILPLKDWLTFYKNLNQLKKEFPSDWLIFIGLVENNENSIDKVFLTSYEHMKILLINELKVGASPVATKIFDNVEYNGFKIESLVSKNDLQQEGSDMGHCVGGYVNAIKDDFNLILKITGRRRLTIQLSPRRTFDSDSKDKREYTLSQCKRRFNKKIDWKSVEDLFVFIDKKVPIFPISIYRFTSEFIYTEEEKTLLLEKGIIEEDKNQFPTNVYQPPADAPRVINEGNIPIIDIDEDEIPF